MNGEPEVTQQRDRVDWRPAAKGVGQGAGGFVAAMVLAVLIVFLGAMVASVVTG